MTWIVIIVVLVVIALFVMSLYNRLVSLRNRFKNAFAQIDVQLKRRYDLIPNLVETAKAYMKHERETLEGVIAARNRRHRRKSRWPATRLTSWRCRASSTPSAVWPEP
jgi:LemA protein